MSILVWNSLPAILNVSGSRRGNPRELPLQLHSQPPLAAAGLFVSYPFPLGPTASVTGTGARLSTLCLYIDFTMKYAGFSCHQRCLVTMATGWFTPKVWECSVHLLVSCSCLLRGYWGDSEPSFHMNNQLGGRDDIPPPLSCTAFLCPQASRCSHSWTLGSFASFLPMPRSRSRWCLVPQTWQTGRYIETEKWTHSWAMEQLGTQCQSWAVPERTRDNHVPSVRIRRPGEVSWDTAEEDARLSSLRCLR